MIIIIGGSSHVGKTYLAQKLMERLNYPYVSLDHLKMGFIRTGRTSLTVNDDYEMRFFLWPFVAEMIKTAIENDQNLIVEGCYVPGDWRKSFTDEYLEKIRCTFIVMSEDYLRSHESDVREKANVIENRICDEVNIERLINCSNEFRQDCTENGIDCLEISEKFDIESMTEHVLSLLD